MLEIRYRKLGDLKKLPNNPRQITKDALEKLKTSIKDNPDYFEARPLILSNRTGELVILAGNQRYEAAKTLGLKEVPTALIEGLTEEREREIIIRDNVENGEWDFDALANEWDVDELKDWGVDVPCWEASDEVFDRASEGSIADYDDDTSYSLDNLFKHRLSPIIKQELDDAIAKGEVRPEIAEVLRCRAAQCFVPNFGELTKFYRSGDASETEKSLLKELFLVFITPREAFEGGVLEIDAIAGRIYSRNLMESDDGGEDDED